MDHSQILLFFYIDYVEYYSEVGMNWGEFINSKYNNGMFSAETDYVQYGDNLLTIYNGYITPNELPIPNANYTNTGSDSSLQ